MPQLIVGFLRRELEMKRHLSLIILALFLGVLSSLWIFMQAQAQIDAFTFFIPYFADDLDDQFDEGYSGGSLIDDDIFTTISIAVHRDNTIIYYDHWEDGLEANLTSPIQPSTQVWGDGIPANGTPPGIPGDVLSAGDVIVLQNSVVVPRNLTDIFYDGGDKLTAVGGNLAVTLVVWPEGPGILYAGAWELYPTSRWGTEYRISVGEDLAGLRPGFEVTGLNVQAVEDGTTVEIDLDADGVPEHTVTLNQGQQYILIGEQTGIDVPLQQSVLVGSQVQVTNGGPVQVHVFTANPASSYEARAYSMVPFNQWTDDYLAPRSSDGDFWFYNPDPINPLTVVITSTSTVTNIIIPAGGVTQYPAALSTTPTGIRFTSSDGRPFYGVAALDATQDQDWGYALQPVENLTTQVLIGLGIGNNNDNPPGLPLNPDGDQSPVYVTAVTTTTLHVDYNNDGITETAVLIPPLAEVSIVDPDHDLTGAFLFTSDGVPFISVWGQDQFAPLALPSIDAGTSIVPLPSLVIQKRFDLFTDADGTGTITWGDRVRFTLSAYNNSSVPLLNGRIEDLLQSSLTYVPGSSTVNGLPIPDDGVGATLFPFDEGGYNVGNIPSFGTVIVTFDAVINPNFDVISNGATADADNAPPPLDPTGINVPLAVPRYELDKRLIDPPGGLTASGEVITFGLTITSTGNISITRLPLRDTFDENYLTFLYATPSPDITGTGVITWSDLATTTVYGPLPPGRTINLTVTYVVDQIPVTVTSTINVATVEGAQGIDGSPLPSAIDDAGVNFSAPPPPAPPPSSPPSSDDDDDDDDEPSPPTPTPTPAPIAAVPAPEPTSALPVILLPETGMNPSPSILPWFLAVLSVLALVVVWVVRHRNQ
jgi:uncharacterized repeat protein (TIGR01451 family)